MNPDCSTLPTPEARELQLQDLNDALDLFRAMYPESRAQTPAEVLREVVELVNECEFALRFNPRAQADGVRLLKAVLTPVRDSLLEHAGSTTLAELGLTLH